MQQWFFLGVAIACELMATTALKASDSFSRLWPSLIVVVGYAVSFYFLSLAFRTIPVGIAYAIWSGVGVTLLALIAWLFLGQSIDLPGILGIGLIVAGVVVLNFFSKSTAH